MRDIAKIMTDAVQMANRHHVAHREHVKNTLGVRPFMRREARADARRRMFDAAHDPAVAAKLFDRLPPDEAETLKRHLVALSDRPVESLPPWLRPHGH